MEFESLHGTMDNRNVLSYLFSSPEHKVLRVSYCDHSLSVGVRRPSVGPSVRSHFLVYTQVSTNINQ